MRRCQIDCDLTTDFDLFGKEPEFYYKGKSQKTSWFGKCFSVLYVLLYVAFLIYKFVRMAKKVDIDFYETYAFSGIPSIQLNNDLFYGGFTIGGDIDETIYYPVLYHYTETLTNGVKQSQNKIVPLTLCSLDKFGKRFQPLFADQELDNLYCIENVQETLEGYSSLELYSYYYIAIMPCVGINYKGEECKPIEKVTEYFQQTYLEFKLQDIVLTPKDYDNPSEARTMDIKSPVFSGLYQSIYTYMQIVNLETDQDWLGFEALSDIKKEQFLRYDESWIIASPSPHTYGIRGDFPITDITVQLSNKVLTTKRTNTKLIEVLGDVGGLMEVISSVFNVISIFIADLLYDIDIVNNLFSFDLGRKVVILKKDKKEIDNIDNIYADDEINIYNNKKSKKAINIKFNLPKENFEESKSINNLNKRTLTQNCEQIKIKKKKKLKSKKTISSAKERKKEMNSVSNNVESPNIRINSNENKKENEVEKHTIMSNNLMVSVDNYNEKQKTENDNKNEILDEIYINNFFIVFAFCCIRRRKNVNNFVLAEGLELIAKRLDIMNIFKRIYYDERVHNSYMKETEEIIMSDKCKEKLL